MPLVKAKLIVHSAPYNDAQDIEFMFNPQEISFTRNVGWHSDRGNRGTTLLPKVNFAGLDPYEFTLQNLLFDTYEKKTSVMDKYINNIKQAVTARDRAETRPPVYVFTWGERYFHCVVTNLTYRLAMFLEDGTPVRAFVDIALREVDPQVGVGGKGSNADSNTGGSLFDDTSAGADGGTGGGSGGRGGGTGGSGGRGGGTGGGTSGRGGGTGGGTGGGSGGSGGTSGRGGGTGGGTSGRGGGTGGGTGGRGGGTGGSGGTGGRGGGTGGGSGGSGGTGGRGGGSGGSGGSGGRGGGTGGRGGGSGRR